MFYLFEYNLYTILSFYCILRAEYAACFLRKPGAIANGKERGASNIRTNALVRRKAT